MKRADAFEAKELSKEQKESLPDVYVDDLLMTLKYFIDEEKAHLWIKDDAVCAHCGLHFTFACPRCGEEVPFGQAECIACASTCPP